MRRACRIGACDRRLTSSWQMRSALRIWRCSHLPREKKVRLLRAHATRVSPRRPRRQMRRARRECQCQLNSEGGQMRRARRECQRPTEQRAGRGAARCASEQNPRQWWRYKSLSPKLLRSGGSSEPFENGQLATDHSPEARSKRPQTKLPKSCLVSPKLGVKLPGGRHAHPRAKHYRHAAGILPTATIHPPKAAGTEAQLFTAPPQFRCARSREQIATVVGAASTHTTPAFRAAARHCGEREAPRELLQSR